MKKELICFSQRYVTALRKQFKQGPQAGLQPAVRLGRTAVALGLETLELARIHEQALAVLELSNAKNEFAKRAGIFFNEVNIPIEETHRSARQNKIRLTRVMAALNERTAELAATNRQLQWGVVRRKVMEDDFAERGRHHQKCLEESLELQKRLRQLTHKVIAAQEDERKKISRKLQDEIGQTLLGINVRLLSLKREARNNNKGFKNEIANAQQLVAKSARSVRKAGREIGSL